MTPNTRDHSLSGTCTEDEAELRLLIGSFYLPERCQKGEFKLEGQLPNSFPFGLHAVALDQIGRSKNLTATFVAFVVPRVNLPTTFELSGWGDFPYNDSKGAPTLNIRNAENIRWSEFEAHRSEIKLDRLLFSIGKRGFEQSNNRRLLNTKTLPALRSQSQVKLKLMGDLGRPISPSDIINDPPVYCAGSTTALCYDRTKPVRDRRYGRPAASAPPAANENALRQLIKNEAIAEIREFAEWKRTYPDVIEDAYLQDDTLAGRQLWTFLDPSFFIQVCNEARAIHPNFKLDVVLYCANGPGQSYHLDRYPFLCSPNNPTCDRSSVINLNSPTWQIDAFKKYLDHYPDVRNCVDDLWYQNGTIGPEGGIDAWTPTSRAHISQCIDTAKNGLQKDIHLGVYFGGYNHVSLFQKISMFEMALRFASEKPIVGLELLLYPRPWAEDSEASLDSELTQYLRQRWKGLTP